MDGLTRRRFDDIEARLEALPKAIASAFGEAFDNARPAIMREADTRLQAFEARSDARIEAMDKAAERHHAEMMRKFQ